MRAKNLVLIAALVIPEAFAAERTVVSFAGNGEMAHIDATSNQAASFSYPTSVCHTADGSLYVADSVNHVVRAIDRTGVRTLAGVAGVRGSRDGVANEATFDFPQGVACKGLAVFVADSGNATVRKIENGLVTTIAGSPLQFGTRDAVGNEARFVHPVGLAVDVDGSVLVADASAHNIRRIGNDNVVVTLAGGAGIPGYADSARTSARFKEPRGIAIDARGMIFVADRGNHLIRQIDANGVVSTFAGQAGATGSQDGDRRSASFHSPVAIHPLPDGSMLIADSWNHTIRMIDRDGEVSTVAGVAGTGGYVNGDTSTARFDYPLGVTADGNGTVYIADMLNQRIRAVTSKAVRKRSVRP